jgi:PAS domain S-box-containing protein
MTNATSLERAPETLDRLQAENADLHGKLEIAEETIRAIQQGAVDAFVLEELSTYRVYTLQSPDRHYRMFVEQMQQGVATLQADGVIAYGNRRLAELLKVPNEELVGAFLRDFIAPDDLPTYENLLWQGRTRSGRGEARLRRSDGMLMPAYLTFNVLPGDAGGAMIGVFVTDLTAQKHHEELAAAQQALQDVDQRKNEFLAMLAHELRNPLAAVSNAVRILQQGGSDTMAVQSTSAMLDRQVGQMVRLVDELLDMSRISRNSISLRKERVELGAVLRQAIESSRMTCEAMRHELAVELPDAPICLDADPVRLSQVFANLLDNACKYMEKGGRIRVSAEVSTGPGAPGEVVVRVRDSGIGIAAEQRSRIFDLFAQVDTSFERSQGGLGIGLTLVKRLVDLHGGRVQAQSDGLGRGSEFVVHLPLATEPALPVPTEPKVESAACYRILVADDNQDSAESLSLLLKLQGHETYATLDGQQAVEAATALRPDVVLLDIGMPKLNGYDACRTIRAESWGKHMVLIAQTGYGQPEDKLRIKDAGFDGHLVKPVDVAALMDLIASLRTR